MGSIVLLSGPVGAGKTTIAKRLVKMSPGPLVYIEGDLFWPFIAKSARRKPNENFRVLMRSMIAAALPFAKEGFETIVDFSIPTWFLEGAMKIAAVREVPLHYIVVRPSEAVCASRALTREEGKIEDYFAYSEFYRDFDAEERHVVCNEDLDPEEVAAIIRKGLDAGKFLVTRHG